MFFFLIVYFILFYYLMQFNVATFIKRHGSRGTISRLLKPYLSVSIIILEKGMRGCTIKIMTEKKQVLLMSLKYYVFEKDFIYEISCKYNESMCT